MANRANGIHKYVMIVEADVNIAITRADWLAPHGYQAVLVRSVEGVIEKLSYLRPQLVFVGRDHSKRSAQIEISQIVQLIRTVCPGVPMITIEDRGHKNKTEASRAADVIVCDDSDLWEVSDQERARLSAGGGRQDLVDVVVARRGPRVNESADGA